MCDLVFSIQEFLKLVPGLVLFPLSFYLAWKKLGIKITASYTFGMERTIAPRITEVIVMNHKDRSFTVFAIYAVMDQEICWEIDRFEPPLVLKPLESTRIETNPYSELMLGGETFEPEFMPPNNIDLYLVLSDKVVKCATVSHPTLQNIPALQHFRRAIKQTKRFNNIVYNDRAAYAITYLMGSEIKTAIVDRSGFIGRNWNYRINMVPAEAMVSKNDVTNYLKEAHFDKMVKWFVVDILE